MSIYSSFHFLLEPPPLWIIQIGEDELIFSQVREKNMLGDQDQLFIEPYTLLLNKVANPTSLSKGLQLFCEQKKLTKIRAWFLLPAKYYPLPLLAHELFQLLVSVKGAPIVVEAVYTSPLSLPSKLTSSIFSQLTAKENYLRMFNQYHDLHPGWLIALIVGVSIVTASTLSWIIVPSSPSHSLTALSHQIPLSYKKKRVASKRTPPLLTLTRTQELLTTLGEIIHPSIVLEKFLIKPISNKKTAPLPITLNGITAHLPDLLNFTIQLQQKIQQPCNLSSLQEILPTSSTTCAGVSLYRFSLTIGS